MHNAPYWSILKKSSSLWAACSGRHNIPEIARCVGLAPVTDIRELTFFINEVLGKKFIESMTENIQITFSATDVDSFESYQYKGTFQSIRPCTADEVILQQKFLDAFSSAVEQHGHSREKMYAAYDHQPSFAVSFRVQHIFEQTPHKGTGKMVINL